MNRLRTFYHFVLMCMENNRCARRLGHFIKKHGSAPHDEMFHLEALNLLSYGYLVGSRSGYPPPLPLLHVKCTKWSSIISTEACPSKQVKYELSLKCSLSLFPETPHKMTYIKDD